MLMRIDCIFSFKDRLVNDESMFHLLIDGKLNSMLIYSILPKSPNKSMIINILPVIIDHLLSYHHIITTPKDQYYHILTMLYPTSHYLIKLSLQFSGKLIEKTMVYLHDLPLLVGGLHPNWRTHIFQRGRYTTNQFRIDCIFFKEPIEKNMIYLHSLPLNDDFPRETHGFSTAISSSRRSVARRRTREAAGGAVLRGFRAKKQGEKYHTYIYYTYMYGWYTWPTVYFT